ncbi:MAG: hypothetical protein F4Z01_06965 [Gammaproteobacteria bacterium]|nr:hypothetical protein [Gammaproteobacteria bacterium]
MPRAKSPATAAPMKRLTVNLPPDLHRAFKVYCTEKGVEMSTVIVNYVHQCLKSSKRD